MEIGQSMDGEFEIIWNSLEEETKDTVCETSWLLIIWGNSVNDVHLEIKKLAID